MQGNADVRDGRTVDGQVEVVAPSPPSKRWYLVAVGVLAIGSALALAWFLHALTVQTDAVNVFSDIAWRRDGVVEVVEAGDHTVWTGPACNGACRPESADTYRRHLSVGFRGAEGAAVPVRAASEQYFNVGSGREGRAVWVASFEAPGPYTVELSSDGEVTRPRLWLSAGRGLPIRTVRGSSYLLGGAAVLATVIATATRLLRRRAFDRMAPALGSVTTGRRPVAPR